MNNVEPIKRETKPKERQILGLMCDDQFMAAGHFDAKNLTLVMNALPGDTKVVAIRNDMVTLSSVLYFYHKAFPVTNTSEPIPYLRPVFEDLALDNQPGKHLVLKDLGLPAGVKKRW